MPDQKTAERIAQAILVSQCGEKRVSEILPLVADGSDKNYWMGGGHNRKGEMRFGAGYEVWIDKRSGCVELVTDAMK